MRGFIEIPGTTSPYTRLLRPVQNHFESEGAQATESPSFAPLYTHFDNLSVAEAAQEAKPIAKAAGTVPRQPCTGSSCQQAPTSWHGTPRKGKATQFYGNVRIK